MFSPIQTLLTIVELTMECLSCSLARRSTCFLIGSFDRAHSRKIKKGEPRFGFQLLFTLHLKMGISLLLTAITAIDGLE